MTTEMTRATTAGKAGTKWITKRGDKKEKCSNREREQKGGREQRRHKWCTEGERSSLLMHLTKHETQEGNTNTSHSQGGSKSPDNTWMRRNAHRQDITQ